MMASVFHKGHYAALMAEPLACARARAGVGPQLQPARLAQVRAVADAGGLPVAPASGHGRTPGGVLERGGGGAQAAARAAAPPFTNGGREKIRDGRLRRRRDGQEAPIGEGA